MTWVWLWGAERREAALVAETASAAIAGLTATLLVWRLFQALELEAAHASAGLTATIWLLLAAVELDHWHRSTRFRHVRLGIASVFGASGAVALIAALTILNPVFNGWSETIVAGPGVLNTLLAAYLMPACMLVVGGLRLRARIPVAMGIGTGLVWFFAAIRHFWQGGEGMTLDHGISAPESLSYSLAVICVGAILFFLGVMRGVVMVRRMGTVLLGLAAGKVFLLDAASLTGLIRVAAFAGLAAALGGLAWLDRWAKAALGRRERA